MKDKMRQAYEEKMDAQIKQLEARIAQIEAKAEQAKAEAKIEYQKEIEQLRGQQEKVQSQLQTLGEASGDAWEDVKDGVDEAFESLKGAVASALSRFEM